MLQLTVRQPWASLCLRPDRKGYETRGWRPYPATLARLIVEGLILHAAAGLPGDRADRAAADQTAATAGIDDWTRTLPRGAALAVVHLVDIVPIVERYNQFLPAHLNLARTGPNVDQVTGPPLVARPDGAQIVTTGRLTHHGAAPATGWAHPPRDIEPMRPYGDWTARWAWQIGPYRVLDPPLILRGAQGLRECQETEEAAIRRQIGTP